MLVLVSIANINTYYKIVKQNNDIPADENQPIIIAVPGGPGYSHTIFNRRLDPLAENYTVIYYDPPGTGRSQVNKIDTLTIEFYAIHFAQFCAALQIKKPVIYAHSASCHYAAIIEQLYPDLLYGALLSNPVVLDRSVAIAQFKKLGGKQAEKLAHRVWIDKDVSAAEKYSKYVSPLYDPIKRLEAEVQKAELNAEIFFSLFEAFFSTDFPVNKTMNINNWKFLLGANDPFGEPEKVREKIELLAGRAVNYEVFERSGHDNLFCEQQKTLAATKNFVDGLIAQKR